MAGVKSLLPRPVRRLLRAAKTSAERAMARVVSRLRRPRLYSLWTPERVGVALTAPSDMRVDERIFLYAFVRGLQPDRVLEIGVLHGGSGLIMANAMEENGRGRIVGVDPAPNVRVRPAKYHGRYELVSRPSPEGIEEARRRVDGTFDLVLIDGLHIHDQAARDIAGVLPHMAEGGYLLFHDAFHYGVAAAIEEALAGNDHLHDCGYVCRTPKIHHDALTPYNGIRLLRFDAAPVDSAERILEPVYARTGQRPPPRDPAVLNHDGWYCRTVAPCARCREASEAEV